jgi:hypothetical protein
MQAPLMVRSPCLVKLLPTYVAYGSTANLPPVTWDEYYDLVLDSILAASQPFAKEPLKVPRHVYVVRIKALCLPKETSETRL